MNGTTGRPEHLKLVGTAGTRADTLRRALADRPASRVARRFENGVILAVSDLTAVLLCATAGMLFDWLWTGRPQLSIWVWCLPALHTGIAAASGLYPSWGMPQLVILQRRLLVLFASAASTAALTTAVEASLPATLLISAAACLLVIPTMADRTRQHLQRAGRWGLPVVVYGAGERGRRVLRHLQNEPALGLHPIALVDKEPLRQGRIVEGLQVLGRPGDRVPVTDAAIVALSEAESGPGLLEHLRGHYGKVIAFTDALGGSANAGRTIDFDGLIGLELGSPLARRAGRAAKRATELSLLALSLPIWLPIFGLAAVAAWAEDRRSPFTTRVRIGRDGTPFTEIRFRTMVPNSGEMLRQCLQQNDALRREWETRFRLTNDPRVTQAGRLMRRFGLDGLPQIINVLRGEMALVGPRPRSPIQYAQLSEAQQRILQVAAPGMTGLWRHYGEDGPDDTCYVGRWTPLLDAALLLKGWLGLTASESRC